nr:CDP-alcohol phosphatidyltransferase family protein [Candidatus Sigynarchaeota archaeon]
MVSNKIRHITDRVMNPIALRFKGSRISPNAITIMGSLVMIAVGLYTGAIGFLQLPSIWLIGTILLIALSGFFDMLDGAVARVTDQKTRFGGVLDSTMDRYADGFLIMGLMLGNWLAPPFITINAQFWNVLLGVAGLIGAYLTSYIRSRAEIEGVSMAGVGLIERAERLVAIVIGIVLEIALPGLGVMFYVFLVLTLLMHVTALQRLVHARNMLATNEPQHVG